MGWDYRHREPGEKVRDLLTADLKPNKVLACAVKLRVAYLAVEWHKTGNVGAVVALLDYAPREYFNFGVKYICEDMGPTDTGCPAKILDLLSPVEDMYTDTGIYLTQRWAREWREACRAKLAANANRPRLAVGMVVKFPEPLHFANGQDLDTLTVKSLKPLRFSDNGWGSYRIRRYMLNGATVVGV